MAQVKGTLWFDTNIQDTALKTAQRIRQQLEQQFAKQIDVKFNVQGLTDLGSNSGAAKGKIDELTASMNSHKTVVAEMTRLYEQLNKQVAQFANISKTGMNAAQQTNRESRYSVEIERERSSVYARLNSNMKASVGISGQLNDSMAGLYSVYKAKEFLENVIAIGGQLEQQRVSIAAILHDSAHADDLFGKIKGLALQSPFGVLDLDKYTKQLSAYGFQYNELFDMTKRLADISAGAGTDIGRLALALGHVRSATYLTGITLRQFSMNNIPMLKMLADYYSEIEKRIVTTAEVQKRISAREVGYEAVIEVIKRMTDEGGQFFNMQAIMADTLAGKWKNLKDAIDLMYGEIGESFVGGELKNLATILTELTNRWKELGAVAAIALGTMVTKRAGVALMTRMLGVNTTETLKNALAQKQRNAEELKRTGLVRKLTAAEKAQIANAQKLTAEEVKQLMATGQLTRDEALRAVALGKLSKEQTKAAISAGLLKEAEVAAAANMSTWEKVLLRFRLSMVGVGSAIASVMKSLIFNPYTAIFAAISAGTVAWQRNNEEMEMASELFDKMNTKAQEGLKNIREMMKETKIGYSVAGKDMAANFGDSIAKGGKLELPDIKGLNDGEIMQILDKWTQFIKDYSATPNKILNESFKDAKGNVRSLEDQFTELGKKVGEVAEAYSLLSRIPDVMSFAVNSTNGGLLDDNVITDLKQYDKAVNQFQNSITRYNQKYSAAVIKGIDAAKQQSQTFAEAAKSCNTYAEQFKLLMENTDKYQGAVKGFLSTLSEGSAERTSIQKLIGIDDTSGSHLSVMKSQRAEFEKELDEMVAAAKTKLNEAGIDINKLSEAEKQALLLQTQEVFNGVEKVSEETRKLAVNLTAQRFGLQIDDNVAEKVVRISTLEEELRKLVGGDWKIDIKTATNFSDVITKIRQEYKTAVDYFENVKPLLVKVGIQQVSGKKLSQIEIDAAVSRAEWGAKEATRQALEQYNKMVDVWTNATKFSNATGIGLEDPTKGGKVLKADKKKKTGGTKKDAELEAWRLRVDALKAFYAEWNSLRKEIGRTGAYEEIFKSGIMPDMFDANGKPKYNLDNYADELGKMNDALAANTDARKKAKLNLKKEQFKELTQRAKEASDAIIEEFKRATDEIGKRWDNYKSLYDKTGDKSFASLAFSDNVLWDEKAKDMAEKLRSEMNVGTISYEMSDEEAKKFFDYNTTRGKSLYEAWKQIVDLIKNNYISALTDTADAMASLMTEEEKIAQTEQKIADLRAKGAADNDPRITKLRKELATLQQQAFEKSGDYLKFYNSILSMTIQEAEEIGRKIRENLDKNMQKGVISAKEYLKQVKLINEQLQKLRGKQGDFSALMSGGLQGLFQNKYDKAESDFNKSVIDLQDATDAYNKAVAAGSRSGAAQAQSAMDSASSMKEGAAAAMQGASSAMGTVAMIDKIVHGINDVVQGIKGTFDEIREMYDALGSDTESDNWEGWNTFFSGFSKASQNATNAWDSLKNGNVGGVIQGVVGSFTSWVTEFSRGHDRKLDHQIKLAQEQINAIDRLTKVTEMELNRTLGALYNYRPSESTKNQIKEWYNEVSETRKADELYRKASFGPRMDWFGEDTEKALLKAVNSGEYYDEQLALLLKKRDEIKEQLSAEEDKKDNDSEKIADYKQSIAEIGDQIEHFAEDMAKALYDIDIKSWAQELTDAVVDAWVSGEDAAQAWHDKVTDLVKDVTKNILAQKVVEGALQPVLNYITDEMTKKAGKLDESSIMGMSELLEVAGNNAVIGVTSLLEAMKTAGFDLSDTGKGASSASQVLSGLSEDDQGLLMSYINAIRADVSINRTIMERMIVQIETSLPIVGQNIAEHTTLLRSIEANTSRNALSAEVMEGVLTRMERGEFSIRVK